MDDQPLGNETAPEAVPFYILPQGEAAGLVGSPLPDDIIQGAFTSGTLRVIREFNALMRSHALLEHQMEDLRAQLERSQRDGSAAQAQQISDLAASVAHLRTQGNAEQREEVLRLEAQVQRLEREGSAAQSAQIGELLADVQRLEVEKRITGRTVMALQREMEMEMRRNGQFATLKSLMADKVRSLTQQLADEKRMNSTPQPQRQASGIDTLVLELAQKERELGELRAENSSLKTELAKLQDQRIYVLKDKANLYSKLSELERAAEHDRAGQEMRRKKIEQLQATVTDLSTQLAAENWQMDDLVMANGLLHAELHEQKLGPLQCALKEQIKSEKRDMVERIRTVVGARSRKRKAAREAAREEYERTILKWWGVVDTMHGQALLLALKMWGEKYVVGL